MEPLATPVIRRIRPDDWPLLRALRLEMLADTPIAYGEALDQAAARSPEFWSSRAATRAKGPAESTFLAVVDGALMGAANGVEHQDRTLVLGVYVAPAYRGSGLIGRLIAEIAAWSLASGRTELGLEVARQNPRAVTAYERLGFVRTGASRPHELFPDVDEEEMVRPARWP